MPLNVLDITIPADGGRDAGKSFHLVEMAAEPLEKWAIRVLCAANAADPALDLDINAGIPGLFGPVLKSLFKGDAYTLIALLDDLMTCIKVKPDPARPLVTRPLLPGDIEEVATRVYLKREAFQLCTGFLLPGSSSN